MFILCLFSFIFITSAAPLGNDDIFPCPPQNISVMDKWYMPPTKMAVNPNCSENILQFIIPSDSFATANVTVTSLGKGDVVIMENDYMDQVWFDVDFCKSSCSLVKSSSLWPDTFNIRVQTTAESAMTIEISVSLQKANSNNIVSTTKTAENSPSSLIYFNEWQEGTSYAFVSDKSKLDFKVAVVPPKDDHGQMTILQNVFVYDGGKLIGTLQHVYMQQEDEDIWTDTSNLTVYLAKKVDLRGALFVTDRSNTAPLAQHSIEYVPVDEQSNTRFTEVPGYGRQPGAVTIVGDKDGSTPIDIRQINNGGNGGVFSYVSGGPLASQSGEVEMKHKSLPLHLGGNMNTIYISKYEGQVKYSVDGV